ncbi:hypothetical protein BC940DRAFT_295312 [Gongronella butleri]|nr:hypothetical protein BC940DRAFT_295312 [Gongronella butleri]
MKVLVRLLGHYSDDEVPFNLYQVPGSALLLFRLNDLTSLFHVADLARHPSLTSVPRGECFRVPEAGDDYYVSTAVVAQAAVAMSRFRLAELCKLKASDYAAGLADAILNGVGELRCAKDQPFVERDLPWTPVVSPISSPKRPLPPPLTPQAAPVKAEPVSPPPLRLSQPAAAAANTANDADHSNPMALGKVLQPERASASATTRPHPDDSSSSSKRQRTSKVGGGGLVKPAHTVSSQAVSNNNATTKIHSLSSSQGGPTLLAKRQGKNSRHLTIYAPSYADQLAVSVRSAPLHSNFRKIAAVQANGHAALGNSTSSHLHHAIPASTTTSSHPHHQAAPPPPPPFALHSHARASHAHLHVSHPHSSRTVPSAAPTGGSSNNNNNNHSNNKYLQPGHTLAPLLSPRAAPVLASQHHAPHYHYQHHHPEPKTTGGAIGKQEFAIPPIVPSQQQPPHTAHPHASNGYNSYARASSSSNAQNKTAAAGNSGSGTNNANNATSTSNGLTAATAPMPPQTPTAYSFAALQRQQFLQPFEHLFDTIETTRTLKNTLDDQIRRSSTLLQTLQASTTTIEGLIRSQVKEVQREVMNRMEEVIDAMYKRIASLEAKLDLPPNAPNPPNASSTSTSSSSSSALPLGPNVSTPTPTGHAASSSASSSHHQLKSPPTIVRSQNDIGPTECHAMLDTLRERLDRLESQLEK